MFVLCLQLLFLSCVQAKDSDDDEEVVQVDRDHFMDEFFEQVSVSQTRTNSHKHTVKDTHANRSVSLMKESAKK